MRISGNVVVRFDRSTTPNGDDMAHVGLDMNLDGPDTAHMGMERGLWYDADFVSMNMGNTYTSTDTTDVYIDTTAPGTQRLFVQREGGAYRRFHVGTDLGVPLSAIHGQLTLAGGNSLLEISEAGVNDGADDGQHQSAQRDAVVAHAGRAGGRAHLGQPVESLHPRGGSIEVVSGSLSGLYDQVVLASHSDQSRTILAAHYPAQARLLRQMPYQPNRAVLHSDASVLPRRRNLWAAWNYQSGHSALSERPVAVHYLINRLQPLPTETPVIVSLNPLQEPDPSRIHGEFHYSHPVFTRHAASIQRQIAVGNGRDGIWLAGAWLGYGFHEDGLASALRVARQLDAAAPWQGLADAA